MCTVPNEKNLKLVLRYWRKRRGLSIRALAKKAQVSSVTILRVENENLVPQPKVIQKLMGALDVTMEQLLVDASDDEPHAA